MDKEHWLQERNRINKILGNDKKPIMEYFTIGIFDFTFNNGQLNIGFIDYDYLVDLIYKHNASYEFDLFVSIFQKQINNYRYDAFQMQTLYEIKYAYDKLLIEIVASSGNQLFKVIEDFQVFVEENNLLSYRNVIGQ